MNDVVLTASIDFRFAEQQVDTFVKNVEAKANRLSDIMSEATAPGGSQCRPGASGTSAVQQAIAAERAYQSALTRTESMVQRIGRQMGGNAEMTPRAHAALSTYNGAHIACP